MVKIDPYNHKENYNNWKVLVGGVVPGLTSKNSYLLLRYLNDMEVGINVASNSQKGPRSFIRLNNIRSRISYLMRKITKIYGLDDVTLVTEENLHELFYNLKTGVIRRDDGKTYRPN